MSSPSDYPITSDRPCKVQSRDYLATFLIIPDELPLYNYFATMYDPREEITSRNDIDAEELMAYLRGEPVSKSLLGYNARDWEFVKEGSKFTIFDENGDEVDHNLTKETLMRRFDLIRNYVEDTKEDEISLPFSSEAILRALDPDHEEEPPFNCIFYLSPTEETYPLRYNLHDVSMSDLELIKSHMSPATIMSLARRIQTAHIRGEMTFQVPALDNAHGGLFPFLGVLGSAPELPIVQELLADHPSYLVLLLLAISEITMAAEVMMKSNFLTEKTSIQVGYDLARSMARILRLYIDCGNDEGTTRYIAQVLGYIPSEKPIALPFLMVEFGDMNEPYKEEYIRYMIDSFGDEYRKYL